MTRTILRYAVIVFSFALSAQAQQPAHQSYRLFSGAGEEPCDSLLANLRAATSAPPLTEWCEPPVNTSDSRFTQPNWQPLDYKEHLDIIETMFVRSEYLRAWSSMYQSSHPHLYEAFEVVRREYWPALRAKVLEGFETGRAHLQFADFDIDNDGNNDQVVRMTSWQVVPSPIDDGKLPAGMRSVRYSAACYPGATRYRYFRLEERPDIYASAGVGKYLPFDGYVFQFNGKTYFGISPWSQSLTFRGLGNGPSFFLWNDRPEHKNSCGIIAD